MADAAKPAVAPFMAVGAVLGVGILPVPGAADGSSELVMTVNGAQVFRRALGSATADALADMHLAVSTRGGGVALSINGGQAPFAYAAANAGRPAEPGSAPPAAVPVSYEAPSPELLAEISSMTRSAAVASACEALGIACTAVAWEDAARTAGSCFGPNISDMTLHVSGRGGSGGANMPIFRKPNFADLTSGACKRLCLGCGPVRD